MKKILIVDDAAHIIKEIEDILTMEGYEIITASDPYSGMAQAALTQPDLIITDIEMPKMDGFGFISSLRTQGNMKSIPVIVLSSRSAKEDIQKALCLKADLYLKKPCPADALIESVRYLLKSA